MESVIKLISALSQILWPILGFTTLFTFKKEIAEILRRIKKGKMFGQEIELSDSLQELRVSAETVKESSETLPGADAEPIIEALEKADRDEVKQVLDEATRSPRVALITLSAYIEIAARRALASSGHISSNRTFSVTDALQKLKSQVGGVSEQVINSLKLFMDVRNKLVHMRGASEDDIISALDSGITILRALKTLPIPTNTVIHTDVPLYYESECTNLTQGRGVILESVSPGGLKKQRLIFPTFRNNFEKGQIVSWEWDLHNTWSEAWYIDPETGEKLKGWDGSGEFVGRPLDQI